MKIPAGLSDPHMEIYVRENQLHFIKQGKDHLLGEMDVNDLAVLRDALDNDPKALNALEEMGIKDPTEQLTRYLKCNFGDFDSRADLTEDGVIIKEYWDCGHRGQCQLEGKLCSLPMGEFGKLTPRELEIIKLIGADLADKQIAQFLGISWNTVCAHRMHIEHKINRHSKVGIVLWAKDKGII